MSRFIKPNFTTDNVYVEFRFESSLRKYEPKPHKKVKGENLCNNCCAHHNLKKTITNSPVSRCNLHFSKGKGNQGQQKTVQNKSFGGMSQIHLVSSNKSIKLSKKKVLQDLNSNNNELQMKIYASLVNIERQDNKNGKEEEQVFLNDFQPSVDMDREEEGEGDADFGKIEIDENLGVKMEEKQYQKQPAQYSQENNLQNNEMNAFEHIQEAISHMEQHQIEKTYENEQVIDEDNISLRIENMKVAEEIQEIQEQKPSQCLWIPNEQIAVIMEQKQESHLIKQQLSPRSEKSKKSEQKHSQFQKEQQNPFIRDRPEQDSIISSKLIDQNQMSESMMQKCLAFQGGRIYIDSSGQNFYISVRVFNKLRKNYSKLEDLITTLINQRPYLQGKRQKLRDEFEQYLRNQA